MDIKQLFNLMDYSVALSILKNNENIKKDNEGLYFLATAYYLNAQFHEAQQTLDAIRDMEPNERLQSRLAGLRGLIHLAMGKLEEAQAAL